MSLCTKIEGYLLAAANLGCSILVFRIWMKTRNPILFLLPIMSLIVTLLVLKTIYKDRRQAIAKTEQEGKKG